MSEQEIVKCLTDKFIFLQDQCSITRIRRIFAQAPCQSVKELISYAKNTLGFDSLCTITGLDLGNEFQLIYHLANDEGVMLNIKTNAIKSVPVFDSVSEFFNGAILYEIEVCNLLGVTIKGIPEDIRYPLPDCWPEGQYPLRKDWDPESIDIKPKGEF